MLFPLDLGRLPDQCFPLKPCCCLYSSPSPKVSFSTSLPRRSSANWLFCPLPSYHICLLPHLLFSSCLVMTWQDSRLLILCTFFCLCILFWFGFRSCFIAQGMYEIQTGGFLIVFSGTPIKNVHIIWLYFFQWTYPDFEKANKYF